MVHDLGLLYERTIKFRNVYHDNNNKANALQPLCPTRWNVRKSSIKTTLNQYSGIIDSLKEYNELDYITNDQKDIENSLLKNIFKKYEQIKYFCIYEYFKFYICKLGYEGESFHDTNKYYCIQCYSIY